jgi:hypothetical protein
MEYLTLALWGVLLTIAYGLFHKSSPRNKDHPRSVAGDFLGSQGSVTYTDKYPGYAQAAQTMGNVANQYAGQLGQPYGGQLVAGFSPAQQQSQSYLQNYLQSPISMSNYAQNPLFQAGAQNLYNTVGGQYVSPNSPFTQGMNQYYMSQVYPQMQAQLNQQLARTGSLSGSGAQYQMGNLAQQGQDYLTALGAQNYQTERQNQLNAIPEAMNAAMSMQQAPAAQEQMLYQMGLPAQQQQQSQLTAAYQDYLRQQNQLQSALNPSQGLMQAAGAQNVQYNPGSGGIFSNFIAPALDVGAALTGNAWAIPAISAISGMTSQGGQVNPYSQGVQNLAGAYGSQAPNLFANMGTNNYYNAGNMANQALFGNQSLDPSALADMGLFG